jgi:hypothetical protein
LGYKESELVTNAIDRPMKIDTRWSHCFESLTAHFARVGCAALLSILCTACGQERDADPGQAVSDTPAEQAVAETAPTQTIAIPDEAENPSWLAERARLQQASSASWKVLHDFRFTDRLPESGISWSHSIVADSAKDYIPVHYDHGSGIAIADVDSDGLLDI